MRPSRLLPFVLFASLLALPGVTQKKLTLEQTAGRGERVSFAPALPSLRWAADGIHVVLPGEPEKWLDPRTGQTVEPKAGGGAPPPGAPGPRGGRRAGGGERARRGEDARELVVQSPDKKWIAYVRDNDLWVANADTKIERALTVGGSEELLSGKLDWVYQEEVYGRGNFLAHWWSPDSQHLAFL
jgi:hypothetical protein